MQKYHPTDAHKAAHQAFHALRSRGNGKAVVIARSTGKPLSKKPLPKKHAPAQLRAVEFHQHHAGMK